MSLEIHQDGERRRSPPWRGVSLRVGITGSDLFWSRLSCILFVVRSLHASALMLFFALFSCVCADVIPSSVLFSFFLYMHSHRSGKLEPTNAYLDGIACNLSSRAGMSLTAHACDLLRFFICIFSLLGRLLCSFKAAFCVPVPVAATTFVHHNDYTFPFLILCMAMKIVSNLIPLIIIMCLLLLLL